MAWVANIVLKSGRGTTVDNLQSINKQSNVDSSVSKITNFTEFHLVPNQKLTFIGEEIIVSTMSNEIEYVEIVQVQRD